MDRLAQLIEETTDVRELKRAVSVKLSEEGMATEAMGVVLPVTPRAGRKGRQRYEREGVEGLHVRNRGSESSLIHTAADYSSFLCTLSPITGEQ
jgi:hypothetical protein